jgi:hypothetical protein
MIEEKEYFIPIENEDFRIGRLSVLPQKSGLMVGVDIIQKDSKKIFYHVKTCYHCEDLQDAISQGRQALFEFLNSPRK